MVERRELQLTPDVVAQISSDLWDEQDSLFSKANVVGVGVGVKIREHEEGDTGEPCAKVLVSQKLDRELLTAQDIVAPQVGRYASDVEEVGELLAGTPFMTSDFNPPADGGAADQACVKGDAAIGSPSAQSPITTQVLTQRIRPAKGGFSVGHRRVTAGTIATAVYDSSPFPGIPGRYYILSNNHVLANSNNARKVTQYFSPVP